MLCLEEFICTIFVIFKYFKTIYKLVLCVLNDKLYKTMPYKKLIGVKRNNYPWPRQTNYYYFMEAETGFFKSFYYTNFIYKIVSSLI